MDTTIVFAADVPAATLSDRVHRGELARIATGVYTSDVTTDPAAVVAREWHNIAGRMFPDAVITDRLAVAEADGNPLLEQAGRTTTAAALVSGDAYSAYVLAYDAARFACIALLAQQGLRTTTSGEHYAVEQAVRAQFGDGFRPFGVLPRRRNELEYPHLPSDAATPGKKPRKQ